MHLFDFSKVFDIGTDSIFGAKFAALEISHQVVCWVQRFLVEHAFQEHIDDVVLEESSVRSRASPRLCHWLAISSYSSIYLLIKMLERYKNWRFCDKKIYVCYLAKQKVNTFSLWEMSIQFWSFQIPIAFQSQPSRHIAWRIKRMQSTVNGTQLRRQTRRWHISVSYLPSSIAHSFRYCPTSYGKQPTGLGPPALFATWSSQRTFTRWLLGISHLRSPERVECLHFFLYLELENLWGLLRFCRALCHAC